MRIRTGFVSNSSSSSFIITFDRKRIEPCPHCGRSGIDILEWIQDDRNGENSLSATGAKAIREYLEEWYPQEWFEKDGEKGKDIMKKIQTAVRAGEEVYMIRLDQNAAIYDKMYSGELDGVRVLWRDD